MRKTLPIVNVTKDALVIRIPWQTLREGLPRRSGRPRLTVEEVLRVVEGGRRIHRLGKTKLIGSLRELMT